MPRRSYDPSLIQSLLAERARHRWSLGELSRRSGVPVGTLSTWAARAQDAPDAARASATGFTEVVVAGAAVEDKTAMVLLRHESGWTAELHGAAATTVATKLAEAITRCS